MLVVISDLHFIDGTAGPHKVSGSAFSEIFLPQLVRLAYDKRATELKLILLGDIPDLIRSTKWFDVPIDDRPWGKNGVNDARHWQQLPKKRTVTEETCLRILGQMKKMPPSGLKSDLLPHQKETVIGNNWDAFKFFRTLPETVNLALLKEYKKNDQESQYKQIPVELIYIPGNHDRLINLYPSLRKELQQALGLTINQNTVLGDPKKEWYFPYSIEEERYRLFARHGHQFDANNFAGERYWLSDNPTAVDILSAELLTPIGDAMATEIGVGLAQDVAKQLPHLPELVHKLQEIDNVRPLSRLFEWFSTEMLQGDEISELLLPIFMKRLISFLTIEFVQKWEAVDTQIKYDEWIRFWGNNKRVATAAFSLFAEHPAFSRWLILTLLHHGHVDQKPQIEAAVNEPGWRQNSNIQFIIYGHTHEHELIPLGKNGNRDLFYINSGTWRELYQRVTPLNPETHFVKLKYLTFTIFYHPDEDLSNKKADTVSFDIWHGNKRKEYL